MNFNFGEVLTRAWQIIWKHKVLWIFGILASCGRGGSSGGNSGGGNSGGGNNDFSPNLPPQLTQWTQWIENNLTQFIVIMVTVLCIIWIVVAFLSTIGKIGLIRGTSQAEGGAESLIFGQLFSESMPYFWRMFGLSLILAVPLLIVFVALFAGLIVFVTSAIGSNNEAAGLGIVVVLLGCFCLLIPVLFVVGMILRQSERAIVLEELGVMPALSRGWEIFRANLGPVILMTIILAVIGFVVGLAVAIPIFIIVFPAMLAFISGGAESTTPLIFMGVCICLYFPVALVAQGIMTAYTESAWTLVYMRLTHKSDGGNTPAPLDINPVLPEDNDKTFIAARPNA
jgi:hypothetical protein